MKKKTNKKIRNIKWVCVRFFFGTSNIIITHKYSMKKHDINNVWINQENVYEIIS